MWDREKKGQRITSYNRWLTSPFDTLLNKFNLRKTIRILSGANHFLNTCRKSKVSGPLTTEKVLVQRKFLIKREQKLYSIIQNILKLADNSYI